MKQYSDAVVYVQKHADGSERRTNAIVLRSNLTHPITVNRQKVKGAELEEHVDLAVPVPGGERLKTNSMDELFRPVYGVRRYAPELGVVVGFEDPPCGYKSSGDGTTEAQDWTQASGAGLDYPGGPAKLPDQAAADAINVPLWIPEPYETKTYADGTKATGISPLPEVSPDEQAAAQQEGAERGQVDDGRP
jgi:hypothetical protein